MTTMSAQSHAIVARIVEIWPEHLSRSEIAARLEITKGQACHCVEWAIRSGLIARHADRNGGGPRWNLIIDDRARMIVEMWPEKLPYQIMGDRIGISAPAVNRRVIALIRAGMIEPQGAERRPWAARRRAQAKPRSTPKPCTEPARQIPASPPRPVDTSGHDWTIEGRIRTCTCGARQFRSAGVVALNRPGISAWVPAVERCRSARLVAERVAA